MYGHTAIHFSFLYILWAVATMVCSNFFKTLSCRPWGSIKFYTPKMPLNKITFVYIGIYHAINTNVRSCYDRPF